MKIKDKTFAPYLREEEIQAAIQEIANTINRDYADRKPILIAVLNGAFMFTADLIKMLEIEVEVSFVKVKSYQGMQSSGQVRELLGLESSLKGKDVILLEDIVDSGHTVKHLLKMLDDKQAKSVSIATLLFKPEALKVDVPLQYIGIRIPNLFVVGYGLDYDGFGRQYKEIYQLAE